MVGGLALLSFVDEPVNDGMIRARTGASNDVAGFFRHFGSPEVYGTVALGLVTAGLASGDHGVRDAGLRVAGSLGTAGVLVLAAKLATGRPRPADHGDDMDDFAPFSGRSSFPSGHTTMAFALATSLSDEIDQPLATVGLYTAAAGTAWSRMNDHKHWLSDVVAGAALGYVSAKFATGRLAVFGLRAPAVLPRAGGIVLEWQASW
jgi:membrane-associated phospholipid phosphatase